jgi:predicted dehydrogenase
MAVADNPRIDAVVVATPIASHFELGMLFLEKGKHLLLEKPLAQTVEQCLRLIDLAERRHRVLMVGHVFEYSAAVQQVKHYLDSGSLGRLFYVDSQRVNLGRIQTDLNVVWSFAPHDVSIMNFLLEQEPLAVAARGRSYLGTGNADVAWMTLDYPNDVAVHVHLGWLEPLKVRQMTFVCSRRMLVYDDVSSDSKIRLYDKGIDHLDKFLEAPDSFAEFKFQVRIGDIVIPTLRYEEPLQLECQHFVDCILQEKPPSTDGWNGLRVVRVLEGAMLSLNEGGRLVDLAAEVAQ